MTGTIEDKAREVLAITLFNRGAMATASAVEHGRQAHITPQACIAAMISFRNAALNEAAEVARDRMPAVQCMSVEPVVAACEDIADAITALKDNPSQSPRKDGVDD